MYFIMHLQSCRLIKCQGSSSKKENDSMKKTSFVKIYKQNSWSQREGMWDG